MGPDMKNQLAFLDTETTGLNPLQDDILEVAVAVLDLPTDSIVREYQSLVRFRGNLPKFHLGRFDPAELSAAPPLDLVVRDLAGILEGLPIAGQNPGFDLGFLRPAFFTCGEKWTADYHLVDTATIGHFLQRRGVVKSPSLRSLREWAGCGPAEEQAHRAMGDVQDTIAVYRKFWATFR